MPNRTMTDFCRIKGKIKLILLSTMLIIFVLYTVEREVQAFESSKSMSEETNHSEENTFNLQVNSDDNVQHLKMLSEADLRKMLFDKTNGKADLSRLKTKSELIEVLQKLEHEEEVNKEFETRVRKAMERRNAATVSYKSMRKTKNSNEEADILDDTHEQIADVVKITHRRHRRRATDSGEANTNRNRESGIQVVNGFNDEKLEEDLNDNEHRRSSRNAYYKDAITDSYSLEQINKHHIVKVLYCTGWGYARYYEEMRQTLEKTLPNINDITITGNTYPTPLLRAIGAQVCKTLFIACLGLGLFGNRLPLLPEFILNLVTERRGMIVSAGFLLNLVGNALAQTGAFEVYVDNVNIYSKLHTGEVPSVQAIRKAILELTLLNQD